MNINNPRKTIDGFNIDEIVIWDSGWGYDLVKFKGLSSSEYYYQVIDLTGQYANGYMSSLNKNEIKKYSEQLIQQLTDKYGYKHDKNRIN